VPAKRTTGRNFPAAVGLYRRTSAGAAGGERGETTMNHRHQWGAGSIPGQPDPDTPQEPGVPDLPSEPGIPTLPDDPPPAPVA